MLPIIKKTLLAVNILVIVALLVSGYSGMVNPASRPMWSLVGFAFPVLALADALFVPLWLMVSPRHVAIPVAGLLFVASPLREYSPLNVSRTPPSGSIKVLTFNTLGMGTFAPVMGDDRRFDTVLKYVADSGADIVCLQEYAPLQFDDSLQNAVNKIYAYSDTIITEYNGNGGNEFIALFSKFPILHKEHFPICSRANSTGAFVIDMHGEEVRVVNVHLESVGLGAAEKQLVDSLMHFRIPLRRYIGASRDVLRKFTLSAAVRASQAESVRAYIDSHRDGRIIVCGDFNDHPLSYAHRTIQSSLTDCHRSAGCGADFTYPAMSVRIDNILCSQHWKPYSCHVDTSFRVSDHFPMSVWLAPAE